MLNTTLLTAREVYQLLKDVALGIREMNRAVDPYGRTFGGGQMSMEIDGWQLVLSHEAGVLGHCETCKAPDGRIGTPGTWRRFGTNPVDLLSTWEREQLERLLCEFAEGSR
jgi:hypothetical protein